MSDKKQKNTQPQLPSLGYGEGNMTYIPEKGLILFKKTIGEKGNKARRAIYGKTVTECFEKMKQAEKELMKNVHENENNTLYDAMMKWLEAKKKSRLKKTSYDTLKKTIKRIGEHNIGDIRYKQISPDEIEVFLTELKDDDLSYSTIKKCYDALNAFYRYCITNKDIKDSPMESVEVPQQKEYKAPKQIQWLDSDDIKLFCDQAVTILPVAQKPQYQYGFCLCANIYMGLRVGELLGLKWADIDFDEKIVYVTKQLQLVSNPEYDPNNVEKMEKQGINKMIHVVENSIKNYHNRIIPLNKNAEFYLKLQRKYSRYTAPDDFVCCTRDGKHADTTYLSSCIKKIENSAGTKTQYAGTHLIRHTCASLYYEKGVPTEIIASILGNSAEVCRSTYIHFENLRKAKESAKIVNEKLLEEQRKINDLSNIKIDI